MLMLTGLGTSFHWKLNDQGHFFEPYHLNVSVDGVAGGMPEEPCLSFMLPYSDVMQSCEQSQVNGSEKCVPPGEGMTGRTYHPSKGDHRKSDTMCLGSCCTHLRACRQSSTQRRVTRMVRVYRQWKEDAEVRVKGSSDRCLQRYVFSMGGPVQDNDRPAGAGCG